MAKRTLPAQDDLADIKNSYPYLADFGRLVSYALSLGARLDRPACRNLRRVCHNIHKALGTLETQHNARAVPTVEYLWQAGTLATRAEVLFTQLERTSQGTIALEIGKAAGEALDRLDDYDPILHTTTSLDLGLEVSRVLAGLEFKATT